MPLEKTFLDFKKWATRIQTAGYNGAHTVDKHKFSKKNMFLNWKKIRKIICCALKNICIIEISLFHISHCELSTPKNLWRCLILCADFYFHTLKSSCFLALPSSLCISLPVNFLPTILVSCDHESLNLHNYGVQKVFKVKLLMSLLRLLS